MAARGARHLRQMAKFEEEDFALILSWEMTTAVAVGGCTREGGHLA